MFELHITCTKDISQLKIDFTDGTCITSEKPIKKQSVPKRLKMPDSQKEKYLDIDKNCDTISKNIESVKLPEIDLGTREINIAPELQNMDI